jgi:hypothetical protein
LSASLILKSGWLAELGENNFQLFHNPHLLETVPRIIFDHLFSADCGDPKSGPFGTPGTGLGFDPGSVSSICENRPAKGNVFRCAV